MRTLFEVMPGNIAHFRFLGLSQPKAVDTVVIPADAVKVLVRKTKGFPKFLSDRIMVQMKNVNVYTKYEFEKAINYKSPNVYKRLIIIKINDNNNNNCRVD